jgi:hypothetical protein
VVGNDRRGVWRRQERADGTVASREISVVYEATSVRMDTCVLALLIMLKCNLIF